jgi:hypothetical protein
MRHQGAGFQPAGTRLRFSVLLSAYPSLLELGLSVLGSEITRISFPGSMISACPEAETPGCRGTILQ